MTQSCFTHICDITKMLADGYGAHVTIDSDSISLRFDDNTKARVFETMYLHEHLLNAAEAAVPTAFDTWLYRFRVV